MNELQIFHNSEFGNVRAVIINGEPYFVGKDVAEILGYSNSRKALADHVDAEDKGVTKCDTLGGAQELTVISESGLYSLILTSKLPTAKRFKHWVTSEVLPSIRKTGAYSNKLSPAEQLLQQAQLLVEQEKRLVSVEEKVKTIEAKIDTRQEDFYTIAGYASIRGIKVDVSTANLLGRKATALSKEYEYPTSTTPDPRFGKVNVYHTDILKNVFDEAAEVGLIRGAIGGVLNGTAKA